MKLIRGSIDYVSFSGALRQARSPVSLENTRRASSPAKPVAPFPQTLRRIASLWPAACMLKDNKHRHLSIITSVDLMIALTESPAFRPSCSADARLIRDTISMLSTLTITSAITLPSFTDLTVPLNWFLALSTTFSFHHQIVHGCDGAGRTGSRLLLKAQTDLGQALSQCSANDGFLGIDLAFVIAAGDVAGSIRRAAPLGGEEFLNRVRHTDQHHAKVEQRTHQRQDRGFLSPVQT